MGPNPPPTGPDGGRSSGPSSTSAPGPSSGPTSVPFPGRRRAARPRSGRRVLLRRADLVAAVVGVAALGYTAFAFVGHSDSTPADLTRPAAAVATTGPAGRSSSGEARGATLGPAVSLTTGGDAPGAGAAPGTGSATDPAADAGQAGGRTLRGTVTPGNGTGRTVATSRAAVGAGAAAPGGAGGAGGGGATGGAAAGAPAGDGASVQPSSTPATAAAAPTTAVPAPPVVRTTATTSRVAPTTTSTTTSRAATATTVDAPGAWVPCTRPTGQSASVTFHNPMPSARRLVLVSADCQVSPGAYLASNGTLGLTTVVGTTWAFMDPATGRLTGSITIYAGQRDAWVY